MHFYYFYGLSLFGYIVSCLVFAAVRWFHTCRPYDKIVSYYYPARVSATIISASYVFLLPFVPDPLAPKAWLFTKAFFLLMPPFYAGRMVIGYFGTVKQWYGWRRPGRIVMLILIVTMGYLWLWALCPGLPPDAASSGWLAWVIVGCALVSIAYYLWVQQWIFIQLKDISDDDYSNLEDFPSRLARKALVLPVVLFLLFYPPIIADSPRWLAVVFLLAIVFNTYFLILILHPHRQGELIDDGTEEVDADGMPSDGGVPLYTEEVANDDGTARNVLSGDVVEHIKREIIRFVEEDRQYLNPHLTIKEVAEHCHYGRTYVSFVFKNEFGGFFNYVNRLRLAYADRYLKTHQQAGREEVALASGFNSRQSYYSIRRRMEKMGEM